MDHVCPSFAKLPENENRASVPERAKMAVVTVVFWPLSNVGCIWLSASATSYHGEYGTSAK